MQAQKLRKRGQLQEDLAGVGAGTGGPHGGRPLRSQICVGSIFGSNSHGCLTPSPRVQLPLFLETSEVARKPGQVLLEGWTRGWEADRPD